jgi:hypothetical protein
VVDADAEPPHLHRKLLRLACFCWHALLWPFSAAGAGTGKSRFSGGET